MQKREKEIVKLDDKVQKLERDKEEKVSYLAIARIWLAIVMLCGINDIS